MARLADLQRRLRETREAETTVFSIPGTPYQGTAQAIAHALSRDAERFSWLPDQIAEEADPPLTDDEYGELYALWEQCHDHLLTYALPAIDALPTAEDFDKAINAFSQARSSSTQFGGKTDAPLVHRLHAVGREQLQKLCKIAQRFVQLSDYLASRTEPWIAHVRREVCTGRAPTWTSLETATTKALESLAGPLGTAGDADLETTAKLPRAQLLADATDLLSHLEAGKGLGFWMFRSRVAKRCTYLWRDSRYMGRRCDSPPVLKFVVARLQAQETLDRAWQEWKPIIEAPTGTTRHRLTCLEQHRDALKVILQLGNLVSNTENAVGKTNGNPEAAGGMTAEWGHDLLKNAQAALALLDERESLVVLSCITDRVSLCRTLANPHPVVDNLIDAIEQGNVAGYREELTRLVELHHERSLAERCVSLDNRLRRLAPMLADAIKDVGMRPALAAGLNSFGSAWAWKRARAWLNRFAVEHSADIANELARTERKLTEATRALVALKAWKSCVEELHKKPQLQGALTAWQEMVRKIGKAKGKYVETHRRDARKFMQQCRNAIPAWIMPLHRVAEQVEAEPEVFDVVIVDEASQTGPEGLILQYLAKQCVIVGDNKQISPEAVGVDKALCDR